MAEPQPCLTERKPLQGREFGFLLDEWKATDDNMKYLTTKGDRWEGQPHEVAVLAVTTLEVQDQAERTKKLEEALGLSN